MTISVCISATRPDTIGTAVRSIAAQTLRDFELIVVAQGRGSAQIAQAVRDALGRHDGRVVHDHGRGVSRARNIGVATASGEVVAMLDDDCEAAPDWLEVLASRFRANPRVGDIWGAVVCPPRARGGFGNCPKCDPQEVVYDPARLGHHPPDGFAFLGANLAFTRRAAETIGPFDEILGPGGRFPVSEDSDFEWRAVEHGIVQLSTPAAVVHHTHGWRYGVRALWAFQHNYARGHGAYAAKLTLLGDPWGPHVLKEHRRLITRQWFERRNPALLPIAIRRHLVYAAAYRECLADFSVDRRHLLRELAAAGKPDHEDYARADTHSARQILEAAPLSRP